MKQLLVFSAILLMTVFLFSQQKEIVVTNGDETLIKWLIDNELLDEYHQQPPNIVFIGDETSQEYLNDHGYRYTTHQRMLPGYQPYAAIIDSLQTLATMYSEITRLDTLGPTTCHQMYLDGNDNYSDFQFDVLCMKLSDNPDTEEDEPNFFYSGGIHARETISVEVTMHILTYLLENYGTDADVTNWIDTNQIWVIPVINPDGYEVSVQEWHAFHRKNMRDTDQDGMPDFSTMDGVDLNRNFGYVWGPNGTSSYYGSHIYRGPYEFSELEAVYMRDMIQSRKFWGGITYHSTGEWVIYPLGHIDGACSLDHEIMGELAVNMAVTIPQIDGTGHYTPVQASDFVYTCQGTMGDWSYAEERVFGFTIEVNNAGYGGYYPPQPYIDQIKAANLQAALIMLDRPNYSCLHGHAIDESGNPIEAIMTVTGLDDQTGMTPVEPWFCDATTGRFERPLLPGTYQITFSADGYFDCVMDSVVILSDQITTIAPVLINDIVETCEIIVDEGVVMINWDDAGGYEYIILSSDAPDGEFELDTSGTFVRDHAWMAPATEPKRFYIIQRIQR